MSFEIRNKRDLKVVKIAVVETLVKPNFTNALPMPEIIAF